MLAKSEIFYLAAFDCDATGSGGSRGGAGRAWASLTMGGKKLKEEKPAGVHTQTLGPP